MSIVEHPDVPHLRLFTVDDASLWDSRPQLSSKEFALQEVPDEDWDAFFAALA